MQNSLQKLYAAGSEHYDLGDYDAFYNKMANPQSRQKFYQAISRHYDIGDYDTYDAKVISGFETPAEQGTSPLGQQPDISGGFGAPGQQQPEQEPSPRDMVGQFVESSIANDPFLSDISRQIDEQLQPDVEDVAPQAEPLQRQMQQPEEEGVIEGVGTELLGGLLDQMAGAFTAVGSGATFLRKRFGGKEGATEVGAKKIQDYFSEKAEKYTATKEYEGKNLWDNPELLLDPKYLAFGTARMIPSMAAAMLPGGAALKFGRTAAAIVGGASGGLMEGVNTYRETLERGGTSDEAFQNMIEMTLGSGLLNAIGVGKIFGKAQKGKRLIKTAADALVEGATEWLEEPTELAILAQNVGLQPGEVTERLKNSLAVIGPAMIMGGGGSAISQYIESGQGQVAQQLEAEAEQTGDPAIQKQAAQARELAETMKEELPEEAPAEQPEAPVDRVKSKLDEMYGPETPEEAAESTTATEPTEGVAEEEVASTVTPEPISALAAQEIIEKSGEIDVIPSDVIEKERIAQELADREPIYALETDEIVQINADIERLGSVQAVAERYETESYADRYARQRAERLYPVEKVPAEFAGLSSDELVGRENQLYDKLEAQGLSFERIDKHPEMERLTNARITLDKQDALAIRSAASQAVMDAFEAVRPQLKSQTAKKIFKELPESRGAWGADVEGIVDALLRTQGQFISFIYEEAQKNFSTPKAQEATAKRLTELLITRFANEAGLDAEGIFNPVLSGLTTAGREELLGDAANLAREIVDRIASSIPQVQESRAIAPKLGTSVTETGTLILTQSGQPYKTEAAASRRAKSMGIGYTVVPTEGGFGISKAETAQPAATIKENLQVQPEANVSVPSTQAADMSIEQPGIDTSNLLLATSPRGPMPFKTEAAAQRYAAKKGTGYAVVPYEEGYAVQPPQPTAAPKRELTDEERIANEKALDRLARERGGYEVTPKRSTGMTIEGPAGEGIAVDEMEDRGAQFSTTAARPAKSIGVLKAERALENIKGKFNIPIRVLGSEEDLEGDLAEAARRENEQGGILSGFYDPRAGEVIVLADNVASEEELIGLILPHEIAHYGIRGALGEEGYKGLMDDLYNDKTIRPEIQQLMDENEWGAEYAAGEWLAGKAEGKNINEIEPTLWQKIVAWFRKWLRNRYGVEKIRYTDTEIDKLLREAFAYAQNKNADAAASGDVQFRMRSRNDLLKELAEVEQWLANPPKVGGKTASDALRQRFEIRRENIMQQIANAPGVQFRSRKAEGESAKGDINLSNRRGDGNLEEMREKAVEYAKKYAPSSGMGRDEAKQHLTAIYEAKDVNTLEHAFVRLEAAVMGEEDGLGTDSQGEVKRTRFELPPETRWQHLRRYLQDNMARLQTVQKEIVEQTGEEIMDEMDANMRQVLEVGRAAYRVDKFMDQMVRGKDSFLGRMNADGIHYHDFGLYLMALHTSERRAATIGRKIEKARNEKQALFWKTRLADKDDEFGSGMSENQAAIIIRDMDKVYPNVKQFADEFYNNVTKAALDMRLESGLISREFYDKLNETYRNYVPLKGRVDIRPQHPGVGKTGMMATGIKKAKGRESEANDPFVQALVDYTDAISRTEQNRVRQSFLQLVEANPDPAVWRTEPAPEQPNQVDDEGNVAYYEPLKRYDDNVLEVRVDGESHLVVIHDIPLAESMKNLGMERSFGFFNKVNNYLRAVNIMLSPEFLITNFERDLQTALVHVSGEQSARMAGQTLKHLPSAMKGIWKDLRGTKGEWSDYYEEMKKVGGKVSWMKLESVPEMMGSIEKELKHLDEGNVSKTFSAIKSVGRVVENANEVVEMGTRLAFYRTLRENGFGAEKAAQAAKELTVNFNTRGQVGPLINSLYLFANAGVQGSFRIFRALKHPTVRKIVGGIVALGFLQSLFNRWQDEDEWDQYSDYNKDNYWMWMMPNGKTVAVKVPYGYNVFKVAGNLAEEVAFGNLTLGQAGKRMLSAANDAFNPLGGGSFSQFLSPTAFDPLVQIAENKNFYGGPIIKEQSDYAPDVPSHRQYFKNVNVWSKALTGWLNKITGGTEDVSGKVDINPEIIDHFTDWLGGGLGRFITNTINLGATAIKEGDLPETEKIPVVRQMLRESSEWVDTGYIYEALNKSGASRMEAKEIEHFNDALERAAAAGEISPSQKKRYAQDFERNQAAVEASLAGFPSRDSILERYENYYELDDEGKAELSRLVAQHNRRASKTKEQEISKQAVDYRLDKGYEKKFGQERPKQSRSTAAPKRPKKPQPPRPKRTPITSR